LILLYAWAFPLLGFVHGEARHHASGPVCLGFAGEHSRPTPQGVPLINNLHVQDGGRHCPVCTLARSVTLSYQTAVGTPPARRFLAGRVVLATARATHSTCGSLGSRAPPLS
jgi:hypothetical protein